MKSRMFEFRLPQTRGWPRALVLALLLVLAVGAVTLVIMVGVAVAVVGLALSAGAALWYAVRRSLNLHASKTVEPPAEAPVSWTSGQVHDVEVEVLPIEDVRRG